MAKAKKSRKTPVLESLFDTVIPTQVFSTGRKHRGSHEKLMEERKSTSKNTLRQLHVIGFLFDDEFPEW